MKTLGIVILALIGCFSGLNTRAQAMCVAKTLEVTAIRGVVSLSNGTEIENLSIKLSRDISGKKIVAQTVTNKNGHFSFFNIKPKRYFLTIRQEYLMPLVVEIRVEKKRTNKPLIGLKITMFVDKPGNCSIAESEGF